MQNSLWKNGIILGIVVLFVGASVVSSISGNIGIMSKNNIRGWNFEIVDNIGDTGLASSIALDSNENPHISYMKWSPNIEVKYAWKLGSTWQNETVVGGMLHTVSSLALDSNDNPHIVYSNISGMFYIYKTDSSWSTPYNIDSNPHVWYADIALDSNNYPHISYYTQTNSDLNYAYYTGSQWITEQVDYQGSVGAYNSIVLDSNDKPHISYYDGTNHQLKYAEKTGATWVIEIVDSNGDPGACTSITLDSNDKPHISHYDFNQGDLRYAEKTGATWVNEIVDEIGNVGWYTSIDLDLNNKPHISYHDYTNDDLKYAKKTGSSWENETVDSNGSVGSYTSIALDSSDNVHISYHGNTDLKYAKNEVNHPPNVPSNPDPYDDETGVDVNADLSWTGGDPDPSDTVTYDVYFGTTSPPPKVITNQSGTTYDPSTMNFVTTYYWKIVVWDNHGASTEGPVWSFTTRGNNPPEAPIINGQTSGTAGEQYSYTFVSEDLDGDDVFYYIDWGDGSVEDWFGPFPSNEQIIANNSWSEKGTYMIMARAKDVYGAIGEWGTLEVTMPKNKAFNFNLNLFSWLFEWFPNAFPILGYLLEL